MHQHSNWSFMVVRCKVENRQNILWKISDILEKMKKIRSFHFRFGGLTTENGVVMLYVCFRILRSTEDKKVIENSLEHDLERLADIGKENFRINPTNDDAPFNPYVAFSQSEINEGVSNWGGENNWKEYMLILAQLSKIVADLAKKGLFDSKKRAEVLHLFANMLQLHEAGFVQALGGYQDFINNNEVYPYR